MSIPASIRPRQARRRLCYGVLFLSGLQVAFHSRLRPDFASLPGPALQPTGSRGEGLTLAAPSPNVGGLQYDLDLDMDLEDWGDDLGAFDSADTALGLLEIQRVGKAVGADQVVDVIKGWLRFLKDGAEGGVQEHLADASGYPLEQALELAIEEFTRGAKTVITLDMPDSFPRDLGSIGLVATLREGEDLDLSLFGGREWETIHLDFLATNPLLGWASHVNGERLLEASGGSQLLHELLKLAAEAGRAVTVAPLNEELKELYRELGFQEDSLLDPTLMFWVPSEEDCFYAYA
mmetsp:Transcript_30029/g.69966  ORF Transcript_30029/g.69966 Transcript_30029/m.69966 type:complete len:292 (+) Transcript_30029:80-955(+)